MMRSTDTWHGRSYLRGGLRRGREHAFGAARVEHHAAPSGRRSASRRSSGATTRPRSPALPSSVVSTSSTPSARKKSR